jgi:hypothetical protein
MMHSSFTGKLAMSSAHRTKKSQIAANPPGGARPEIEWVGVGALKPAPNNARTHSKRQIKLIARSIERFGFMNPILVDSESGILARHGRWAAAKLLGFKKGPTLRFEHLSDTDKRAYILADNRIAEKAGWDREILAIELQAFVDMSPAGATRSGKVSSPLLTDRAATLRASPFLLPPWRQSSSVSYTTCYRKPRA